jgi:hypothetical protein
MRKISYARCRFPPEVIHQAIWLYLRFTLSFRDVEDLLAERGITVSYETVRRWVNHFGPMIAGRLRKRRPKPHATWWTIRSNTSPSSRLETVACGLDSDHWHLASLILKPDPAADPGIARCDKAAS